MTDYFCLVCGADFEAIEHETPDRDDAKEIPYGTVCDGCCRELFAQEMTHGA